VGGLLTNGNSFSPWAVAFNATSGVDGVDEAALIFEPRDFPISRRSETRDASDAHPRIAHAAHDNANTLTLNDAATRR
jgi:hypothetical protein